MSHETHDHSPQDQAAREHDYLHFLAAFERCEIENHSFRHHDHLLMAWLYLRRDGLTLGTKNVIEGIIRFAASKGANDKFNATETLFWIRHVAHLMQAHPGLDFRELVELDTRLSDKHLPLVHWSAEVLRSEAAKRAWLEPNLVPLPRSWPQLESDPRAPKP